MDNSLIAIIIGALMVALVLTGIVSATVCQACPTCPGWNAINPICYASAFVCGFGYTACQAQVAVWSNVLFYGGMLFVILGGVMLWRK